MAEIPTNTIFDAIIIGAGIMGSCVAYEISKLNKKVLLLEQFDLLHHLGSSHGESRTIRATYPEPYYPPMVLESSLLWESAQSAAGYRVLTPTTQLDLGPSNSPSLQSVILNCSPDSLPATIFDSQKTLISGAFRLPDDWIALSTPLGGVIKPTKAVAMFHSLAVRHGAVIRDCTVVDAIIPIAGVGIRVSTTDGRLFHGIKCVVTAGAWTSKLVKMVTGQDLPIQPLHTLIWYWKITEGFESEMTPAAGFPTFASYGLPYVYGTPAMEFPGLIKIAVHAGWPCDPNCRDWSLEADEMVARVAEWIERVMPGRIETAIGPVMKQSCMYSMTPDEDFVIDFMGGEFGKDVVLAGGFSGHGFKMAPLVGKMVAEMVIGGEAQTAERIGVDSRVFGLGRFEGGGKGNLKEFGDQVKFHLGAE
ncbi:probable sarcosine oxidase [Phalaenopsis equestris]|uniref:probable sarcosine oxidase n=1 Tax=Phalaenopsis equestris TaxID=78828 RepID=UPI0009E562FA|nr:probable sarcosine oxidase [Phalaenopsis equestris]